ncbi:MAG: hypothetical protein Q8K79_18835, partial [Solirubrobacteraceae bacterium]|nr:hypothetical protein [Solirubrobacteraceae bacterium]
MDDTAVSVINQVLNQLEQRGAHAAMEQPIDRTMVRAVPHSQRRLAMTVPLLVLGLVLVAGITVWQWMQARKPALSLAEGPQVVAASTTPLQPAVVAIPAPASAVPVATAGEVPLAEVLPTVARVIAESSSPPSVPRQDPGQRATTKPLVLSTVEGSGQAASTGSGQALRDEKNSPVTSGDERRPVKAAPRSTKPQPM